MTGTTRAEIEEALREEFDLAEPGAIVDRVLGPPAGRIPRE
jgi:hypothetical protein